MPTSARSLTAFKVSKFTYHHKAAFDFYLSERKEPEPCKRKKLVQRFERAKRNLLAVTRQDVLIKQVGRAHARKLRGRIDRDEAGSFVSGDLCPSVNHDSVALSVC